MQPWHLSLALVPERLTSFHVYNTDLQLQTLDPLAALTNLVSLHLPSTGVPQHAAQPLTALRKLQELWMSQCMFADVTQLTNLRSLGISAPMQSCAALERLRHLSINYLRSK